MSQIKRRAISSEQKEKRRQDILDSAKSLFESCTDYNALLMKHIAENIGLTKGTLYLYFKTKEEVFLAIYTEEFNACFDAFAEAFSKLEGQGTIKSTAAALFEVTHARPTFLRLNAMLHSVLEQNIEFETALTFKTLLRDRLLEIGQKLEQCLPKLKLGQGVEYLLAAHALMIGYYHATSPTPALEEILDRDDMSFMRIDFNTEYAKALERNLFAMCEQA